MGPQLVVAALLGALATDGARGSDGPPPAAQEGDAGLAELERIDVRIAELNRALVDADAEAARCARALGAWCLDRLDQAVSTWEPLQPAPAADLGSLYGQLWHARLGFDPLSDCPAAARATGAQGSRPSRWRTPTPIACAGACTA